MHIPGSQAADPSLLSGTYSSPRDCSQLTEFSHIKGFFFKTFLFSLHTCFIIFIIKCSTKSEKWAWSRGFTQQTSVCVLVTQGGIVCGTEVIVGNTCALRKGGKWSAHHWAFFLKKVCGAGRERNVTEVFEDLWVRPIATEENCRVALVLNQSPVDVPSVEASRVSSHGVSALICDVFFLNLLGGWCTVSFVVYMTKWPWTSHKVDSFQCYVDGKYSKSQQLGQSVRKVCPALSRHLPVRWMSNITVIHTALKKVWSDREDFYI